MMNSGLAKRFQNGTSTRIRNRFGANYDSRHRGYSSAERRRLLEEAALQDDRIEGATQAAACGDAQVSAVLNALPRTVFALPTFVELDDLPDMLDLARSCGGKAQTTLDLEDDGYVSLVYGPDGRLLSASTHAPRRSHRRSSYDRAGFGDGERMY